MTSDYVDNWDALTPRVQDALTPILGHFEEAADLLFDRRLNLSFEAAVKDLSIPGVVALTQGFRALHELFTEQPWEMQADGTFLFDSHYTLTVYDLPIYTPCVYVSQLAQHMDGENVRVWKETTATEILDTLLVMARYVRPDIETARVVIAALHDMVYLYPMTVSMLEDAPQTEEHFPNAVALAAIALQMTRR